MTRGEEEESNRTSNTPGGKRRRRIMAPPLPPLSEAAAPQGWLVAPEDQDELEPVDMEAPALALEDEDFSFEGLDEGFGGGFDEAFEGGFADLQPPDGATSDRLSAFPQLNPHPEENLGVSTAPRARRRQRNPRRTLRRRARHPVEAHLEIEGTLRLRLIVKDTVTIRDVMTFDGRALHLGLDTSGLAWPWSGLKVRIELPDGIYVQFVGGSAETDDGVDVTCDRLWEIRNLARLKPHVPFRASGKLAGRVPCDPLPETDGHSRPIPSTTAPTALEPSLSPGNPPCALFVLEEGRPWRGALAIDGPQISIRVTLAAGLTARQRVLSVLQLPDNTYIQIHSWVERIDDDAAVLVGAPGEAAVAQVRRVLGPLV